MTEYLKISEIASRFNLSKSSINRYEKQGLIHPDRTPGGHRLYNPDEFEALLKSQSNPSFVVKKDFSNIVTSNRSNSSNSNPYTSFGQSLTNRDKYAEFGTTGLRQWNGSIYEERLRELRGREGRILYREMRLNDPIIAAVFFALVNGTNQAQIRIKPASDKSPDKRAAEHVEECMHDMSWSWTDQRSFITEPKLEQGFSLLEVIYKKRLGKNPPRYISNPASSMFNDGLIGWRKLAPRPAESLAPGNEWVFDENGGIQGVWQQPENDFSGQRLRFIPIEKLLHFRTTVHPANNPEGMPIHRGMYLPYYYSKNIMEIEGIGIERDLAGIPVMYLGEGSSLSGTNSDYEIAKELVTNIRNDEQVGVVIPSKKMGTGMSDNKGMLLELLNAGGARQYNTSEIIDRYDKRKAVATLAQFIMLGMTQVGSFALSKNQSDLFVIAAGSYLSHDCDILNRHAIPDLIDLNSSSFGGELSGYPQAIPSTIGIPDLAQIGDYVNKLVEKEVITIDPELERHMRQLAGLPQISTEIGTRKKRKLFDVVETIRKAALASKNLEDLGISNEDEIAGVLRPLVDELKESLISEGWISESEAVQKAMDDKNRLVNISSRSAQVLNTLSMAQERNVKNAVTDIRVTREQLKDSGFITDDQFEDMELKDGRLPNGLEVSVLFASNDPIIQPLLDLGVPDPVNVLDNEPDEILVDIVAAIEDCRDRLLEVDDKETMKKVKWSMAALENLKSEYEGLLIEEVGNAEIENQNNQVSQPDQNQQTQNQSNEEE